MSELPSKEPPKDVEALVPLPDFADRLGKADGSDDISMFFYTLIRVAELAGGRIRKTAPETVAFGSPSGHRRQQICKAANNQQQSLH